MDPISLTTAALALIGVCVTVGTTIKNFIERTKTTKTLLLRLLNRLEHVRIHLANLRSLTARLVGSGSHGVVIPFTQGSCETTLRKLERLVGKIVNSDAGKLKMALAWMQEKHAAEELVVELEGCERGIMTAMAAVAALSSVVTKETVERMIETTQKLAIVDNPFKTDTETEEDSLLKEDGDVDWESGRGSNIDSKSTLKTKPAGTADAASASKTVSHGTALSSDPTQQFETRTAAENSTRRRLPAYEARSPLLPNENMWFGQISREEFPRDYRIARDRLADAAFTGRWSSVFTTVDNGLRKYQERWINAARIKPVEQIKQTSLWTPLHQAAFLGAPIEAVEQMAAKGAYRTLRTAWTKKNDGLSHRDQTAAEIARDMGYSDLYDILCPIIRHPIPFTVLDRLQQQLHTLLRELISDATLESTLRLPELSVITELETPMLRFPIYRTGELLWTFQLLLDGRELVLRALRYFARGPDEEYFRISAEGYHPIEEPVVSLP